MGSCETPRIRIIPKADPERDKLSAEEKADRDAIIARVAEEARRRCTCNQALMHSGD